MRDKAWFIRSYPCTGMGIFLTPTINPSPAYNEILSILRINLTHQRKLHDIGSF
ncbi:hypothetical protein BDZ45DRAFT_777261 [Acephala macrosclerotiorum]|nr:hypothetical protein BDZ45DRAFT_777261 [Acephala macrosclerotiorum]